MKKAIVLFSFLLMAIFSLLYKGLFINQHILASNLLGKKLPNFQLKTLAGKNISINDFKKPMVLNIFASWCSTCKYEHIFWQRLDAKNRQYVFGVAYKDSQKKVSDWLNLYGNPYQAVMLDPNGSYAMELGVYGTPETFVVDKNGIIRYRNPGAMTSKIWQKEVLPILSEK